MTDLSTPRAVQEAAIELAKREADKHAYHSNEMRAAMGGTALLIAEQIAALPVAPLGETSDGITITLPREVARQVANTLDVLCRDVARIGGQAPAATIVVDTIKDALRAAAPLLLDEVKRLRAERLSGPTLAERARRLADEPAGESELWLAINEWISHPSVATAQTMFTVIFQRDAALSSAPPKEHRP